MCASIATGCGFTGPALQAADDGGVDAALPPAEVNFASASSTQDEQSGAFQVEVSLSRASTTPITVTYALVDHSDAGWATPGVDFTGGTGSITFAPGEMIKGIDLTIISDNEDEEAETFELALASATGDATLGDATSHTVTISAFILPRVSFMVPSGNGMESATSVQLVLSLNTMATSDVTVGYSVTGSAALMTGPYPDHSLAATGTATIPAGMTSLAIPVTITNDTTDEDDEHLLVTLSSSTNAVVDPAKKVHDYTITDDDNPPDVTFDTASMGVMQDEAAVDVTLHATLSARSEKLISVGFVQNTAVTNAATATADFTYTTVGPLTWSPGTTTLTQDIVVHIVDDNLDEYDELLETVFAVVSNVNVPAGTKSTVTIKNVDAPSVVRFDTNTPDLGDITELSGDNHHNHDLNVMLDKPSGKPITVDFAPNGGGGNTATYADAIGTMMDYTLIPTPTMKLAFAPGDTTKVLTIRIRADNTDSDSNREAGSVTLTTATNATVDPDAADNKRTFTIVDDD